MPPSFSPSLVSVTCSWTFAVLWLGLLLLSISLQYAPQYSTSHCSLGYQAVFILFYTLHVSMGFEIHCYCIFIQD